MTRQIIIQFSTLWLNHIWFTRGGSVVETIVLGATVFKLSFMFPGWVLLSNQSLCWTIVLLLIVSIKFAHYLVKFIHFQILVKMTLTSRTACVNTRSQNSFKLCLYLLCGRLKLWISKFSKCRICIINSILVLECVILLLHRWSLNRRGLLRRLRLFFNLIYKLNISSVVSNSFAYKWCNIIWALNLGLLFTIWLVWWTRRIRLKYPNRLFLFGNFNIAGFDVRWGSMLFS